MLNRDFMEVAANGNIETVRLLLDRGAEINQQDILGVTALMKAAANGHIRTVRLLLDRGAEINQKNIFGTAAITWAANRGRLNIVRLLLNRGADVYQVRFLDLFAPMNTSMNKHHQIRNLVNEKIKEQKIYERERKAYEEEKKEIELFFLGKQLGDEKDKIPQKSFYQKALSFFSKERPSEEKIVEPDIYLSKELVVIINGYLEPSSMPSQPRKP